MTRTTIAFGASVICTLGLLSAGTFAQDHDHHDKKPGKDAPHAEKAKPLCPVSGEPINLAVSTKTPSGPVFFCCEKCVGAFKKDEAKYAKQVEAQRKILDAMPKVQVTCPVSGKPVTKKAFTTHDGKKILFCCKDCIKEYEADPAKYAAKLAGCYTWQTKCPVMDEEISPRSFIELTDGTRIYFCCSDCEPKFQKHPEKYTAKLESQGFKINPEKVKGSKKAGKKE